MTWEAGWRYGIISTVMVGVMVSYLRLWLALWYHIYGYGWRYGIISTVMVGVMVSYLRLWLALWYHIYGSLWTAKNIQINNLISENILSSHQFNRPPVSSWTVNCFDVYAHILKVIWKRYANCITRFQLKLWYNLSLFGVEYNIKYTQKIKLIISIRNKMWYSLNTALGNLIRANGLS